MLDLLVVPLICCLPVIFSLVCFVPNYNDNYVQYFSSINFTITTILYDYNHADQFKKCTDLQIFLNYLFLSLILQPSHALSMFITSIVEQLENVLFVHYFENMNPIGIMH